MNSNPLGPVVVGVDFSTSSQAGVFHAAWEAERRDLNLVMVHGFLVPTATLTPLAPLYDEKGLIAAAEKMLLACAQVVRSQYPQLSIATKVVRGSGAEVLVKESASATVVVVGARGHGGFEKLLIGSVFAPVAAHAHCPVVVVRSTGPVPARVPAAGPVLVGVDGSADSDRTLDFAFAEAAARVVPLIAVHSWSVPELTGLSGVGVGVEWARDPDQARLQMQESAERILSEAIAGWQERYPQVSVKRWTVHNFATAGALLEVAHEVSAGLLVVGSRGRGGFAGLLLGSVGQALIRRAAAPVAVIHPHR